MILRTVRPRMQALHGVLVIALASFGLLAGCAGSRNSAGPFHLPAQSRFLPSRMRVVGAFGAWDIYARHYTISAVPAGRLTHILYCFGKIGDDGGAALGDQWADAQKPFPGDLSDPGALHGNFGQIQILKRKHPHLQAVLSIGGWNGSQRFSDVAAAPQTRRRFAASCITVFLKTWPGVFDGIDLDWEYPVAGGLPGNTHRPADRQNFTLLVEELRRQLDAQGRADGRRYLLTVSVPAGPEFYVHFDLAGLAKSVDWFNLMAYDFHTASSPLTGFNAPLYAPPGNPSGKRRGDREGGAMGDSAGENVDAAVKAYRAAGVPAAKIVVGIPCYGYGFAGVPDRNHGLYQPHRSVPPPGTWAPGSFDYKDLKAHYLPSFTRYWQPAAKVPWLYQPAKGLWISYDDPESVADKTAYVRSHGLGGVMLWELSQDDGSLVDAVNRQLGPH